MRSRISASSPSAVAMKRTRLCVDWTSRAKRLLPLRAPPRTRVVEAMPGSSREDRNRKCARGQVSWLSDRPTPRAFPASRPVALAGFVPDHSDGVAADSHRLPWGPRGRPGANNAGTVPESARCRKADTLDRRLSDGHPSWHGDKSQTGFGEDGHRKALARGR